MDKPVPPNDLEDLSPAAQAQVPRVEWSVLPVAMPREMKKRFHLFSQEQGKKASVLAREILSRAMQRAA